MRTMDARSLDWVPIRQAMALAMALEIPMALEGAGDFVDANPRYLPLWQDLCRTVDSLGCGTLCREGNALIVTPGNVPWGRREICCGERSSLSEIILFLLPALSRREFRSVLECTGVTHAPGFLPTSVLKETIFSLLEGTGHYAGLQLKRFGFYGSGGGSAEVRVYPAEKAVRREWWLVENRISTGAKIFLAHMNKEIAERQKEALNDAMTLPDSRVAIIEVMDAAGYGNSVQVFMDGKMDGDPVSIVLSREIVIHDNEGNIIFDLYDSMDRVRDLAVECNDFLSQGHLPPSLLVEALPFAAIAGLPFPPSGAGDFRGTTWVIEALL